MKIVDLRTITIAGSKIVRVDTDEGIHGYGEANWGALGPVPNDFILALKPAILGLDPTNVEQVMLHIRHYGGNAHMGVGVSAVSTALWDIAGKAAGLPAYKLLGGKIRDRVRIYCDTDVGLLLDPNDPASRFTPEAYAERARQRKALPDGYTIMKFDIGFHGQHFETVPGYIWETNMTYPYQGHATERGIKSQVAIVEAIKEVLGDEIGLAIDCGPGQSLQAVMTLAKALEPYNLAWLEDPFEGADVPYVDVEAYRLLSDSTTTPILTGEHLYLRNGFRDLIANHAVDVVSPDIQDVGGLAESKWVAELADLYNVLVAPHNANHAVSFMANLHAAAVMPRNYIAFEFHQADDRNWDDILEGVDRPLIKDGFATVPDSPGLGFELNEEVVRQRLAPGETYFE